MAYGIRHTAYGITPGYESYMYESQLAYPDSGNAYCLTALHEYTGFGFVFGLWFFYLFCEYMYMY